MKINEIFKQHTTKWDRLSNKGSGKGPQHTTAELADEFKMTMVELNAARRKFPGFPEGDKKYGNAGRNGVVYYDLAAARHWFKAYKAS